MIQRLSLGTPLTEGRANVYLLDADPITLVDTGINTATSRDQLPDALADHGVSLADVERVILTHAHADHGGLSGLVKEASGATVYAHEADLDRVAPSVAAWREICDGQYAHMETWDIPDGKLDEIREVNLENHRFYSEPLEIEPFVDGDTFTIGDEELTVVHTPGHTLGSCCFELSDGIVFTGDTLLPSYTANIGGTDMRLENPIGRYLQSLQRIAERRPTRAFPGHRDPIDDPIGRIRSVGAHHRSQERALVELLAEREPADIWTLASALFVDLQGIHIMLGTGETYAHLQHMEELDLVTRSGDGYVLVDDEAACAARLEARWPL